jgi:hypothetical protein
MSGNMFLKHYKKSLTPTIVKQKISKNKFNLKNSTTDNSIKDIEVIITTPPIFNSNYDPERILLLLPNSSVEFTATYTTINSYTTDLQALSLPTLENGLFLNSLTNFFSSSPNQIKNDVLIAACTEETVISDFFDSFTNVDITTFGYVLLIGQSASPAPIGELLRQDIVQFQPIVNYANSMKYPAQVCVYENSSTQIVTSPNVFQIYHDQIDITTSEETSGYLMEKWVSYFAQKMSSAINPNFNTKTDLRYATDLQSNTYSQSLRNLINVANMNQYYNQSGFAEVLDGTLCSGQKIEKFSMTMRHIPFYLKSEIALWLATQTRRASDLSSFISFLANLCIQLELLNITAKSSILNDSSYQINSANIVYSNGRAGIIASISLAYNDNIVNITIEGDIVQVTVDPIAA